MNLFMQLTGGNEMNYWPANVCNLADCEDPLFDLLERMAERGKVTAKTIYGASRVGCSS
jgi:hypothetical protein